MRRTFLRTALLSGAALLAFGAYHFAIAQAAPALVIQGGALVDGNGGAPLANAVVVIEGNRIAAAGRVGQVQIPAGAQIIDAKGKWLTPGLMDAQSNWNWPYGEAYIHWGVTSAMVTSRNDEGLADREAVAHGVFTGPRLFQSFVDFDGPGADGKRPDTYQPGQGNRVVRDIANAREQVRYNIASGADFIGVQDGNGDPAIFAAIADEAHKAGFGVTMRCVGPITRGKACVLAGADVMIHSGEIGVDMNKDYEKWKDFGGENRDAYCDMDPAKEQEIVQVLKAHPQTAIQAQMTSDDRGFLKDWPRYVKEDEDFYADPVMSQYYPLYQKLHTLANNTDPHTYLTQAQYDLRECGHKNYVKFLRDFIAAGGHVVAASNVFQTPPGIGMQQEITSLQDDVGMTPMQALQTATKWVALHFHMLKDLGTIEKGKLADILIVDADPTKDIKNLRQIDAVIKDGKVMDRSYHAGFKGWLFADDPKNTERDAEVASVGWAKALKQATFRPGGGGEDGDAPAAAGVPDPWNSPTPGIETMMPHTLIQGSPTQQLDIKGFNFVKRSVVLIDGKPVPAEVVSRTEIKATVDQAILNEAGKKVIEVKNPLPLAQPQWGDVSNAARLLVPFSYTAKWSENKDTNKN